MREHNQSQVPVRYGTPKGTCPSSRDERRGCTPRSGGAALKERSCSGWAEEPKVFPELVAHAAKRLLGLTPDRVRKAVGYQIILLDAWCESDDVRGVHG